MLISQCVEDENQIQMQLMKVTCNTKNMICIKLQPLMEEQLIDNFQKIEQLINLKYFQEMNHKHEIGSDLPKLQ
jgi:hypothetical protein